jgi:hypothetical protein
MTVCSIAIGLFSILILIVMASYIGCQETIDTVKEIFTNYFHPEEMEVISIKDLSLWEKIQIALNNLYKNLFL